jgi:predicted enzyme related to lactoylglutathione lyase
MSGIVWWEIVTPDPERFQAFHGQLWGWTFRTEFEGPEAEIDYDYWLVLTGEDVIGGLQRAAPGDPPPAVGTRLYVEVDDLEATFDQVIAAGGSIERPRTALGGDDRWFGTILDPTGVSLGVWTSNPSE